MTFSTIPPVESLPAIAVASRSDSSHGANATVKEAVLVDAHVHIHRCFDIRAFLDHAAANFRSAAAAMGLPLNSVGCLMLSESEGVNRFREMQDMQPSTSSEWTWHAVRNGCSLVVHRCGSPGGREHGCDIPTGLDSDRGDLADSTWPSMRLVVIAGRQIATAERLEVLALATTKMFPDGARIEEVIDRVVESGAVCVLPWGFGKWTGRRGRIIERIIGSPRAERIFLGDNSGRLAVGPRPKHFKLADAGGIRILPGTDPFPLTDQVCKPGRYGFVLPGALDGHDPADQLRIRLSQLQSQPRVYGQLEGIPSFLRNQLFIQVARRWTA